MQRSRIRPSNWTKTSPSCSSDFVFWLSSSWCANQDVELTLVEPDQTTSNAGVDHGVARSTIRMRFHLMVTGRAKAFDLKLSGVERLWCLLISEHVGSKMLNQHRENGLLHEHAMAGLASCELGSLDFADYQFGAAFGTTHTRWSRRE